MRRIKQVFLNSVDLNHCGCPCARAKMCLTTSLSATPHPCPLAASTPSHNPFSCPSPTQWRNVCRKSVKIDVRDESRDKGKSRQQERQRMGSRGVRGGAVGEDVLVKAKRYANKGIETGGERVSRKRRIENCLEFNSKAFSVSRRHSAPC